MSSREVFNHRAIGLASQNPNRIFTSDLSVNEFLLVSKSGFRPVGLCMGVCVFHMGIASTSIYTGQEIIALSKASYQARHLAIQRMQEEARAMNADGIVGVRINIIQRGDSGIEFHVLGTGIAHEDPAIGKQFRAHDGSPFTSDFSGQDFYTLLSSGYRPVELVMGCCVYHIAFAGLFKSLLRSGRNVEMEEFTQGIYAAREIAMDRMQEEAIVAKAEGVVGSRVSEHNHGWSDHTREFFAIGTAIKRMNDSSIVLPDLRYNLSLEK